MSDIHIKDQRKFYVDYKLPNLCALCANALPTHDWMVPQSETDSQTTYDLFRGFITTHKHRNLDFSVGVCDDCYQALTKDLEQHKKLSWYLTILLISLGVFGFIGALVVNSTGICFGSLFILVLSLLLNLGHRNQNGISFLVSLILPEKPIANRSIDGRKFSFLNPKYETAFAELNPKLVYNRSKDK